MYVKQAGELYRISGTKCASACFVSLAGNTAG